MKQDYIKIIREACIKANPKIEYTESLCEVCDGSKCNGIKNYTRDVRLADVLLALDKKESIYVRQDGVFFIWEKFTTGGAGHHGVKSTYTEWNLLSDSLNNQSEETIAFIYNLLK